MTGQNNNAEAAIRRLWQFDQAAICQHFLRLDPGTRRMRFGGAVSAAYVNKYAEQIMQFDSAIYGAFVDGTLLAVAELRGLFDGWPATAEAAFSVERKWQDQGIGDALLTRVIAAAQNRGVKTLYMICLTENKKMQHLAAKHSAVLKFHRSEVEASLDPPWPTPYSIAEEMAGETGYLVNAVLHWPDPSTE